MLSDPLAAVRRAAHVGTTPSNAELTAVRRYVAARGYDPSAVKRVSSDIISQSWPGGVIRSGARIPSAERDYIRHGLAGEWPIDTTLADFVRGLREATIDQNGAIFLDRTERGTWSLTFISKLDRYRGPRGSGWILVGFDVDYGWWTVAFQPIDGPAYVATRSQSGVGRWLKAP